MENSGSSQYITAIAGRARDVSLDLASRSTAEKNRALEMISKGILDDADKIIRANAADIEFSLSANKSKAMIERLTLDRKKIESMARAVLEVAALPDPVGSGNYITKRPNGLKIQKIRVPLGVVAMIYESRPNVTSDAAALTIKSGNAVILRGGKEAINSNIAIALSIRNSLSAASFPEDAVQLVEKTEHEVVDSMLKLDNFIDVVIPRGGEDFIRSVVEKSRVPVIKHDKGVCHIYVDEFADRAKAESITINAKCQRPSVCNAAEKLLLHENYAFKREIVSELMKNGVEVLADEDLRKEIPDLPPASETDWITEYLDLKITAGIVRNVKEAADHINHYGSHLSDAIISENYGSVQYFLDKVDSAAVFANASTRFTDGGEFGLGTEVGISTQKLHVRGPMGLEGLTTEKWIIYGDGQIRE